MIRLKKIKLINEGDAARATELTNRALQSLQESGNIIEDIVYSPVGGAMGGYNCIMIVYSEALES